MASDTTIALAVIFSVIIMILVIVGFSMFTKSVNKCRELDQQRKFHQRRNRFEKSDQKVKR